MNNKLRVQVNHKWLCTKTQVKYKGIKTGPQKKQQNHSVEVLYRDSGWIRKKKQKKTNLDFRRKIRVLPKLFRYLFFRGNTTTTTSVGFFKGAAMRIPRSHFGDHSDLWVPSKQNQRWYRKRNKKKGISHHTLKKTCFWKEEYIRNAPILYWNPYIPVRATYRTS